MQEAIIFHPVKMRNNQRRRVQVLFSKNQTSATNFMCFSMYYIVANITLQHEHLTEDHQELITFVTESWVGAADDLIWFFLSFEMTSFNSL